MRLFRKKPAYNIVLHCSLNLSDELKDEICKEIGRQIRNNFDMLVKNRGSDYWITVKL